MALTPQEQARLQFLRDQKRYAELQQMKAMTHEQGPIPEAESESFKVGRTMPPWARAALKTAEVLSFGISPKAMGPEGEQMVRGATTQFEEENPKTAFGMEVLGAVPASLASMPRAAIRATTRGTAREIGPAARILQAGGTGAAEGVISGAGYSQAETPEQFYKDILTSGLLGGAGGAGTSAVTNIAGPIVRNVGERMSEDVAISESQKRLAQALMRDAPESYGTDFAAYVNDQMRKLGPEGRLYDVGENTRKMADLLSSMPGRARTELVEEVQTRRAGRGERMASSAQEALQTGGKRLASTVEDLQMQRSTNAAPLYTQAYQLKVTDPSGRLAQIVQQANRLGATKVAQDIAENERITKGLPGWSLTPDKVSSLEFNVSDLDRIKQGLDTLIGKNYDPVEGKYSPLGRSLIELRDSLKSDLVRLTTDPKTKDSLYGQALEEYAGPSALIEAAKVGKTALNRNVSGDLLRKTINAMTQSEKEAFQIGLFEVIREKVGGSSAGRTEMMNLVENFVPREKLEIAFGSPDAFAKFYETVNAERIMREADVFGRGSQSVPRMFEAGELDIEPALDFAATGGSPVTMATQAVRALNRAQMPERTRNQLAKALMQRGPQAQQDVFDLEEVVRRLNEQRAQRAAAIGGAGGAATTSIYQNR
jgi:hypothetical protein